MVGLRNISIKRKLMLIIMGASSVALLLISAGFVSYELLTFRQKMVSDLATLADIIGNRSTAALTFENKEDAEEDLNALRSNKGIVSACLYKDNTVFAHYPKAGDASRFPALQKDGARFQGDHLLLFREILQKGDHVGTLFLESDLQEMRARLELYAGLMLLFLLVSLAITFLLSARLQRIITKPIFHLAQIARRVSTEKNFSLRARKHAEDELGQLIDGFNEMLGQIQQRDAALQEANDQLERRVQQRTYDLQLEIAERKRAETAIQQQFTRISLLNQITQIICERQDLQSILQVVLRQLQDRLAVDFGSVGLFDSQTEALNLAALRVKNPLLVSKLDLHEGPSWRCQIAGCSRAARVNW